MLSPASAIRLFNARPLPTCEVIQRRAASRNAISRPSIVPRLLLPGGELTMVATLLVVFCALMVAVIGCAALHPQR
jgi:hypothetical protein